MRCQQQFIFLAMVATLGCAVGLPAAEVSVNIPELTDEHPHEVERRDVHPDACLSRLYVMAFTSGASSAGTDGNFLIEVRANGEIRRLLLYDRPGDDAQKNKGDLWTFNVPRFGFSISCIRLRDIQGLAIIARSNDGWQIESITTFVRDVPGGVQVLTQDLNVNRKVDLNGRHSERRFDLTLA